MLVRCGSTSRVAFLAGAKDSIDDWLQCGLLRNKQSKELHIIILLCTYNYTDYTKTEVAHVCEYKCGCNNYKIVTIITIMSLL